MEATAVDAVDTWPRVHPSVEIKGFPKEKSVHKRLRGSFVGPYNTMVGHTVQFGFLFMKGSSYTARGTLGGGAARTPRSPRAPILGRPLSGGGAPPIFLFIFSFFFFRFHFFLFK